MNHTFHFPVLDIYPIDGDSYRVTLDVGMRMRWEGNLRLCGLNCPEIRGREKPAGNVARDVADSILERWNVERVRPEQKLMVRSEMFDKFGRLLGDVYYLGGPEYLGRLLLKRGLAKPYYGGRRERFSDEEIAAIVGSAQ